MKTMFLVAALGLSGAAAGAAPTKAVDRTVPLSVSGSVILETHNGSIEVRTWDRAEVAIHAQIEAAGTSTADLRRFEDTNVDITAASDTVRITSQYSAIGTWSSWFGMNPTIRYTITAPRTARWTIHDHNASVEVHDVRAALTVDTHNGSVHATGLDGPLQVTAHNGSVTADFVSFRGADVTTHNGPVELVLPSTAAFNLHADLRRALVHSDFPVTIRRWSTRQDTLEAAASGGGPTLYVRSHLGPFRLRSR